MSAQTEEKPVETTEKPETPDAAAAAAKEGDGKGEALPTFRQISEEEWQTRERERRDSQKELRRLREVAKKHAETEAARRAATTTGAEPETTPTKAVAQKLREATQTGEFVVADDGSATYKGVYFADAGQAKLAAAQDESIAEATRRAEQAETRAAAAEARANQTVADREVESQRAEATRLQTMERQSLDARHQEVFTDAQSYVPVPKEYEDRRDRWLYASIGDALNEVLEEGVYPEDMTREQHNRVVEAAVKEGREMFEAVLLKEQIADNEQHERNAPVKAGKPSGMSTKSWPETEAEQREYLRKASQEAEEWSRQRRGG